MKKILSTRVLVKICVLTTILLVLIIYTIWGNSALMVSMVNISSDRIASAFSNFRIAQVSDLHNAEFGESNTELIELLSEHEPDIIVITGDLIDAGHTDIEIAFDFIKQAVQIAPVYFVTGNHEANFSHYDQFKTGLEASGVTVLEDEAIQLVHNNEMITLIGLSDSDFTIKGDMFNEAPAMVNTKLNSLIDDENSYTILLSHRPELFETYVCCGVDLVLCIISIYYNLTSFTVNNPDDVSLKESSSPFLFLQITSFRIFSFFSQHFYRLADHLRYRYSHQACILHN